MKRYLITVLLFFAAIATADDAVAKPIPDDAKESRAYGNRIFWGEVVGVSDGDTITMLDRAKKEHKIRLLGIDCPELSQPHGMDAKKTMSALVLGKDVVVTTGKRDKYGRVLGSVYVLKPLINVNLKMIEKGWAWHYKEYSDDKQLAKAEAAARKAKLGLWKDEMPTPPWEYRKSQREKGKAAANSQESKAEPRETPRATTPTPQYWLNTKTNVRHAQSCRWFKKTKAGRLCTVKEGKPCGICLKGVSAETSKTTPKKDVKAAAKYWLNTG